MSINFQVWLLKKGICLVYTPDREHFGIGPIEAMAASCPVIACASGGPLETVVNGSTGLLCQPTSDSFAEAMRSILEDKSLRNRFSSAARKHVLANFSPESFKRSLLELVRDSIM